MTNRRGGSLGPKDDAGIASGIWSLTDQQQENGAGTWGTFLFEYLVVAGGGGGGTGAAQSVGKVIAMAIVFGG